MVVSSLSRAAQKQGLTVVCTIHQPSGEVFHAFDNLLLLRKGGVCVYNGAINGLDSYMGSAPNGDKYALPDKKNPADHVLDVFCGPLGEDLDWGELYNSSEMAKKVMSTFEKCSCSSCEKGAITTDTSQQGWLTELYIVLQRQLVVHWRTPSYMAIRFLWTAFANLLVG